MVEEFCLGHLGQALKAETGGWKLTEEKPSMNVRRRGRRPNTIHIESQDDIGYLTGEREEDEKEKQVRTPGPRRSSLKRRGRRKEEDDSDS